jgi:hypothetical protein
MRNHHQESIKETERALATNPELVRKFHDVVEEAQFFGRVEGLREGLELYEYGLRIQEKRSDAFRAMMKFIVRCAEHSEGSDLVEAISAKRVCDHLDREISRIREQKTSSVNIRPPENWGCTDWTEALEKKRSNVDKLLTEARFEALSQRYCTLMAWKTWGKKHKSKKHVVAGGA